MNVIKPWREAVVGIGERVRPWAQPHAGLVLEDLSRSIARMRRWLDPEGHPQFCPCCTGGLEPFDEKKMGRYRCKDQDNCGWVFWNSPKPVSAVLVPAPARLIGTTIGLEEPGICVATWGSEVQGRNPEELGVALIRRANPPFEGEWAIAAGYVNPHESARKAAEREGREELGARLEVRRGQEGLYEGNFDLGSCAPSPRGDVVSVHHLGMPLGGILQPGDDALEVGIFGKNNLPRIPMSSHAFTIGRWFDGVYGPVPRRR